MIKQICKNCKKEFKNISHLKAIFCSRKCWKLFNRGENHPNWKEKIKIKCQECNKVFNAYPYEKEKRFCGVKCYGKWQSKNIVREKSTRWNGGKIKIRCRICLKVFYTNLAQKNTAKFCSKKCQDKGRIGKFTGKNSPTWKGGKNKIICKICNKIFFDYLSNNPIFCSPKCKYNWMSENISGEQHPNWLGGKSFEPYGIEFNGELKEQVRIRDNYRCQQCFRHQDELYYKNGKKYSLIIHHIDYNKRNNNPKNLLSLCLSCHLQTNYSREDWTNYFQHRSF